MASDELSDRNLVFLLLKTLKSTALSVNRYFPLHNKQTTHMLYSVNGFGRDKYKDLCCQLQYFQLLA